MRESLRRQLGYGRWTNAALRHRDRDVERAYDLLAEALRIGTTITAPYPLAMALADSGAGYLAIGEGGRGMELLDQALTVATGIDVMSTAKDGALTKIARKYADAGHDDMAYMVTDILIGSDGVDRSWAKAGIAVSLAERARFAEAIPVVFAIEKSEIRLLTLTDILLAYAVADGVDPGEREFLLQRIVYELG